MPDIPAKDRAASFIGGLRTLHARADRGSLAALRRGLSPATTLEAWPVVARLGGEIGQPGEAPHVDIAALFAMHPMESEAHDFGETCHAIALQRDGSIPTSMEARFRRLIASDSVADLTAQLRSWVRLAASQGVGVNYTGLLIDLWRWRHSAEDVRVRWAQSFWRSAAIEAAPTKSKAS